ncbi:MAG: hypothetical protein F7B17_08715 [Desulfurococcales archaeon]|nr:hypothetical protein [Desulfurococcales archaeon]
MTGASEEDLVSMLQRSFKLTRYEAKLYLALLKGASNPKEASSMSGVPLPRIYDVIKVLESKGFVVPSEGWYRPLPPSAVAIAEIARVEGEARSRVRQIMEAARTLEDLIAAAREEVEVTVIEGLYSAVSASAEDLKKTSILFIIVSEALPGREDAILPLVRDAVSRGVKVVIVYPLREPTRLEDLPGEVKTVKMATWLPDMIVSERSVVYLVPDRRSGGVKGIYVRDPSYASRVAGGLRESLGS